MVATVDLSRAMKDLRKDLDSFQRQQVPFATALALTRIAQKVAAAETDALDVAVDRPTPFTKKGVAITPARKSNLTATVFIKDIQAQYLEPIGKGGMQLLGNKRGLLAPRNVGVNAYGNLPRTKLATLKAKPTVFVGQVKTKKGQTNGVWQRVGKGRTEKLKLLIQFTDPKPIKATFDFDGIARPVIERSYRPEFEAAMARAIASAR